MTSILLFFIPCLIVFVVPALLWRNSKGRKRPHWLLALLMAPVVWLLTWLLGLWLFLDIINGGTAGDIAAAGMFWSILGAVIFYRVLRKEAGEGENEKVDI